MSKRRKESDYKDSNHVVQKNNFVRNTNGVMNITALKILRVLISCIDTDNPRRDHSVYITKQELMQYTGMTGKGGFSYIKKTIDSFFCAIPLYDDKEGFKKVALITEYEWTRASDLIRVEFHKDVWNYLIVNKNFLKYEVLLLKDIENKYTLLLYEYLLSYTREKQEKQVYMDMTELRRFTGTERKYSLFKDFENKVLKQAQTDINGIMCGEFLFWYRKEKDGAHGEITGITFFLRKRTSFTDTLDHTEFPERLNQKI